MWDSVVFSAEIIARSMETAKPTVHIRAPFNALPCGFFIISASSIPLCETAETKNRLCGATVHR
ncbi:MAG: hypothetical protein IKU43_02730 [Clostridia bacterium]|nr:hypothetical protein [Clostridia bacterium]